YDVRFLLAMLAINGVLTVVIGGVSWQGHLGGFVAGALSGVAFAYAPRKGRAYIQAGTLGVLWCVMAAAFVTQTAQLNA
ncbi:MAG: rhomboid family intramembrane serine protease, partial [Nocardioidaceae bacterium]